MADKPLPNQIERRIVTGDVRAKKTDAGPSLLSGYGAVFGRETVINGWFPFREVIEAGAFTEALRTDDTLALWNHDTNYVLGRSGNGTLRLSEDAIGLAYEIDVNAADSQAVSVAAKVDRGDVHTSSFAFSIGADGDVWDDTPIKDGRLPLRRIVKVDRLYDVSPVAMAAYPQTTVSARAEARAKELTPGAVEARATSTLTPDHMETITECITELTSVLAESKPMKMPVETPVDPDEMPETDSARSFSADPDTRARELRIDAA
jgi:HK97 family phage prohead protease